MRRSRSRMSGSRRSQRTASISPACESSRETWFLWWAFHKDSPTPRWFSKTQCFPDLCVTNVVHTQCKQFRKSIFKHQSLIFILVVFCSELSKFTHIWFPCLIQVSLQARYRKVHVFAFSLLCPIKVLSV